MAVMARESWTDERLDDLKADMNHRFDEVYRRFDGEEKRTAEGFARVDADVRELRLEMKEMQRTMTHGFMAMSGIMVTGFGAVLGLLVF